MNGRDQIIKWVADKEPKRIADKVRRDLQSMTEGMHSGDDSPLANLWDEICVQMQVEQSYYWELYEDVIGGLIKKHLHALGPDVERAIWLQTDKGLEWAEERHEEAEAAAEASGRAGGLREALPILTERVPPGADLGMLLQPLYEAQEEAEGRAEELEAERQRAEQDGMPAYEDDVVTYILSEHVLPIAGRWRNNRIEKFLDEGRDFG